MSNTTPTPALRTRKPTGKVPAPNILCVGEEGAGKTFAALSLSASERVGEVYVIDFGEGSADQYAPLGNFTIVDHDGSYEDLRAQCAAIAQLPVDPALPPVVVLDSASTLWDYCKDWAEGVARARGKVRGDGEPNITMDVWNAANKRFYAVIQPLLDWPGITILLARGRWAAEVGGNGQPTGQKVWTEEVQKRLGFAVDVVLRMTNHPRKVEVIKARTLMLQLPADRPLTVPGFTFDAFIFDKLKVERAEVREVARPTHETQAPGTVPVGEAKSDLMKVYVEAGFAVEEAKTYAAAAWKRNKVPAGAFIPEAKVAALLADARAELTGPDAPVADPTLPRDEAPAAPSEDHGDYALSEEGAA